MKTDRRGEATLRKRYGANTAVILVGLRLESGDFNVRSQFERPVVLDPAAECRDLYHGSERLFQCCEGSAQSGAFYATRDYRDQCGCIVFTKFDGMQLPADCGMGFAKAAAIACFRALGQNERIQQMDLEGWEVI